MNYSIDTDGLSGEMVFDKADELGNNVFLSLMIPQGVFFLDPSFGLKVRPGLKLTDEAAALRKADIESALKWITESGKANQINVMVQRVEESRFKRLECLIEIVKTTGQKTTFTYYQEVI